MNSTQKNLVVGFAFGQPNNIPANKKILEVVLDTAEGYNCDIYTQEDIDVISAHNSVPDDTYVEVMKDESGAPPPTLRIARGVVSLIKRLTTKPKTIFIVSAPPHAWRCMRDVQEALREERLSIPVVLSPLMKDRDYKETYWFSPSSTQKRTQSKKDWYPREILLKFMPFWIYKRIAA